MGSRRRRSQVFLLSPARLDGQRGQYLFTPATMFPMARALRSPEKATLGEVFAFVSGLYFRGKLAYARAFPQHRALVITHNQGLLPIDHRVDLQALRGFAGTDIHQADAAFRAPLERDARALADEVGPSGRVVLLGSIATKKYVEPLIEVFGERLLFPTEFVGRGDMSRGGLLLRAADAKVELSYAPVVGATRHGARPPKLAPRRR